ncbi:MAG: hypothetical protein DRP29_06455 [Thermodesulfobacteriota bacterium]|nr:MAG: hypothetical protein DRP29_06455 [Thermodesulfobacteriota bacterium]
MNLKLKNLFLRKTKNFSGFTLIEVLIAFSIGMIILATLYTSFFTTLYAVKKGENEIIKLQEVRKVMYIIASELSSVFIQSKNTFFKLKNKKLSFTAFSPLYPSIAKISYFLDENTLYKSFSPLFKHQANKWEKIDLIEDINEFKVEVFYHGQWVSFWDTTLSPSIPEAVKITLSLKIDGKKLMFSQIVHPHIGKPLI